MNFLLDLITNIVAFFFGLTFLFRLFQVNYYNELVQQILALTEPPLNAIRNVFPIIWRIDLACLIVMAAIYALPVAIVTSTFSWILIPWGLLATGVLLTNLLTYALILVVIMSWIAPDARHPAAQLVHQLTAPILSPFRRLTSGLPLDISPIFALIAISLIKQLLLQQASNLGILSSIG
ncbi:MAG: YggT family protein [Gammaproteobacteria bacterium]